MCFAQSPVLLVLVFHLELPAKRPSFVLYPILEAVHRAGWMGVDLFFVLSGFLVSGLLFREYQRDGRVRPGRFLLRRGLKIYPAFWTLMVATVIVWPQESNGHSLAIELAFLQNYWPTIWGHTWSLAVEEHFYLLVAIGCALMARRSVQAVRDGAEDRRCDVLRGSGDAHADRCCCGRLRTSGTTCFQHIYVSTRWRAEWGCLTRTTSIDRDCSHSRCGIARCWWVPGCSFWYRHLSGRCDPPCGYRPIGFTSLYLGAAAMLLAWLPAPEPAHPIARGLAYIGSHSYSMYLWHVPFNHVLFPQLSGNWGLYALAYLCGSVVIGIGMAVLIEFPVVRLRDRYWPDVVRPAMPRAAAV
jgi:peptidoglycan/LPS O-acetylase OafA/YrhL